MASQQDIKNFAHGTLARWLEQHDIAPYRATQIFKWIYRRNVYCFSEMTDISKDLRQWLSSRLTISRLEPVHVEISGDGSRKYLFGLKDGHCVESVLIPERSHWTLCISSQVGCAMECKFCLSGTDGLVRDLEPAEIVNQVCAVQEDLSGPDPLTNIVFMGMGEPLANYNSVVQAIDTITNDNGLQFANRRVTLSTVGLVPRIEDLGHDTKVGLAVSLNAADNESRNALMPINRKYPIETLLSACSRFPLPSRRMITFEYVLIAGLNDRPEDAKRLANILRPLRAKINLIPFNPFEGSTFTTPDEETILVFQKILMDRHYIASIRRSKGSDIGAACGQLRTRSLPVGSATGQGYREMA
jgi:23S rRNA (adenine2503-C2)-methyltransferase